MAINVGGLDAATLLPGFPADSYLDFAIAFPFIQGSLFASINAGTSLARDVETGFIKRLALTPMQRSALLIGNLAGVMVVALLAAVIYLAVGFAAGLHVEAGAAGVLVMLALALLIALAFAAARRVRRAADGLRRGRAGRLPALLRVPVPVLELAPAQPDRAGLVPHDRHLQPGLVPVRGPPRAGHLRLGRRGARARIRHRRRDRASLAIIGASRRLATRLVRTMSALRRRRRAPWPGADRSASCTNPQLLLPSLIFPLFFFVAFAGGLSNVGNVPGLRLPVRATRRSSSSSCCCRRAAFGGVFTGFAIAADFESGFARRMMLAAPNRLGILAGYTLAALIARARSSARCCSRSRWPPACRSPATASTCSACSCSRCSSTSPRRCWAAGVAMRLRTIQAGPADADAGLHRALPRARLRAARAARGLGPRGRAA